jgi:hypothetical protein
MEMEAVYLFEERGDLHCDLCENLKIAGSSPDIRIGQLPVTNGGAAQFVAARNRGWQCSSAHVHFVNPLHYVTVL